MREGSATAAGVAFTILFGFLLLPGLLVLVLYLFFTIMGMIKGTDLRASTLDLPILFTGVAVVVAALVLLVFGGVTMLGRSLTPKKRRRDA